MFKYEILSWDSDFFGFLVCRINTILSRIDDFTLLSTMMNYNKITLAYYAAKNKLIDIPQNLLLDIKLVDKKITYIKHIENIKYENKAIMPFPNANPDKKLLDLAVESGFYSRYNNDKNISKEKFQELYRLWISNSVKKLIASEVLVYVFNDEIVGFVTLAQKNDEASIGIIAVDLNQRGKGIGKALMFAAENWFYEKGNKYLLVITQAQNKPACKLYESCGYTIKSADYFYHIWNLYKM